MDVVRQLLLLGRRAGPAAANREDGRTDAPDPDRAGPVGLDRAGDASPPINPVSVWSPSQMRGRGRLFALVWLAYLVPTFQTAWALPNPARRFIGLVIVVLFAALYVRVFYLARAYKWTGNGQLSPVERWWIIALSAFLTVLGCAVIGEEGLAFTVYLAVMCVLILPMPAAGILVALIMGGAYLAPHAVPGWNQNTHGLVFSIFLGALAIWGIGQMIARNRQLALANEEISSLAVSQERLRFSRDLHDILGHSLTVITLKAELAGRLIQTDPARAEREIAEVEQLARTALADVRATAAGYRNLSLAAELASARTALDTAGIEAELAGAVDDVPTERLELFGWAVREGVTNVVRHSGARHCRVTVDSSAVEITDDGTGPGRCVAGNGLTGLRERAEAAGARLLVDGTDQGGFRLRVGW
ncbi:MAG TPA: sensor histidine kinase [Kineosporiaceae bacterium]|nr:sensor histidine kinase [Kineosporiaceae bacterium]